MRIAVLGTGTVGNTLATKLAWTPEISARETAMLDPAVIRAKVPKFAAALEARHTAAGWEKLLAHTAELLFDLGGRPRITDEVLATIAQRWRLRLVPDHPIELQPIITLRPKHGIRMVVDPRR